MQLFHCSQQSLGKPAGSSRRILKEKFTALQAVATEHVWERESPASLETVSVAL